jgi:hypothetical protein
MRRAPLQMRSILSLLLFCSLTVRSQVDSVYAGSPDYKAKRPSEREWLKRFTWGGNFQAWVGNPTFVFLSPTLGYVPLPDLHVGVGAIYSYSSLNYGTGRVSQSVFGGHSYLRYVIAESYFVQTQFDRLYQPNYFATDPSSKTWVNYFLVGGGFRQRVSDKAAITTSIMYNLTPSPLSIYPTRLILQFGFTAGF